MLRGLGAGQTGHSATSRAVEEQTIPGAPGEDRPALRSLGGRPVAGPCRHHARIHEADAREDGESGLTTMTKASLWLGEARARIHSVALLRIRSVARCFLKLSFGTAK